MPDSFSTAEVSRLLEGEVITTESSVTSKDWDPISIECYLIPSNQPHKWIIFTAVAQQLEIGFIDAWWVPEEHRARVEANYLKFVETNSTDPALHPQVRHRAPNSEAFFVEEEHRNMKIGQSLFDALKSVLQGLQVKRLELTSTTPQADSFYLRNGGKLNQHIRGYLFKLEK